MEDKKEHAEHKTHKKKSLNMETVSLILASLLVLVLIINAFNLGTLKSALSDKVEKAQEAAIKPKIGIVSLTNANCNDCFDVKPLADAVKGMVNVTSEKSLAYDAADAAALIKKYGIKKVPAVILTGEIDKFTQEGFEKKDDALVLEAQNPPYTDTEANKIVGRVTITVIYDLSCTDCTDLKQLGAQLKSSGVAVSKQDNLESNSAEAKALIAKYNIERLPAALLSSDASAYPQIEQILAQVGVVEADGTYVTKMINPPYKDVKTGEVKGLVSLTYLADASCTECYDVKMHKSILEGFGLKVKSEKTVDVSSADGIALKDKYKITALPTVIISKDAAEYPALKQIWAQVGSIESDGSYVFRQMAQLGAGAKYKDLTVNAVVENPSS